MDESERKMRESLGLDVGTRQGNMNEIKEPEVKIQRYRCPFYGFTNGNLCLMESGYNACAINSGGMHPCIMVESGYKPNWRKCTLRNVVKKSYMQDILKKTTAFPKEFHPKGEKAWRGIPAKRWYDYVMSHKCPRPD